MLTGKHTYRIPKLRRFEERSDAATHASPAPISQSRDGLPRFARNDEKEKRQIFRRSINKRTVAPDFGIINQISEASTTAEAVALMGDQS